MGVEVVDQREVCVSKLMRRSIVGNNGLEIPSGKYTRTPAMLK